MEKVSVKTFFTVLWSGVCQAMGWFFGLFGYKRDGKFAKCVWGLFATSATVVTVILASVFLTEGYDHFYKRYYEENHCYDPYCVYSKQLSEDIYYHSQYDGKGYVFNCRTKEKTVKHIKWIAKPQGTDSLVCYCVGDKRGYFNGKTGLVAIEPKYSHAWVFSEGLACVVEDDLVKFINASGKTVINKNMRYVYSHVGHVFYNGYCVLVTGDNEPKYGLMDKAGKIVLPQQYDVILPYPGDSLWCVKKDGETAVLDANLNTVVPSMKADMDVDYGVIKVVMSDHTIRQYDLKGTLVMDFCISDVRMLEYEKEDIVHWRETVRDDNNNDADYDDDSVVVMEDDYHPKATARLRAYVAGDGYEGLMTADGHVVTMPLYNDIEAIGPDIYLCTAENNCKIVVNGRGELVK